MLIDKGMVKIVGREESLGRPLLYGTTRFFLETFGLMDLKSLPNADELIRGDEAGTRGRKAKVEGDDEQPTDESPPTPAVSEAIAAMAEAVGGNTQNDDTADDAAAADDSSAGELAESTDEVEAEGDVDADIDADAEIGRAHV